jgi:hypothetical protein
MPSSYQVVLWKQERFGALRPLQIEFFRNLLEIKHEITDAAKRKLLCFNVVQEAQRPYHIVVAMVRISAFNTIPTIRLIQRPQPRCSCRF